MARTQQQIESAVRDYIIKEFMYDRPEVALANDLPLIKAGIVDSLGIFTLIAFIEAEFGIKVQPDDVVLENFETVDAIRSLVLSRQK
jgi:acyl carrier protein